MAKRVALYDWPAAVLGLGDLSAAADDSLLGESMTGAGMCQLVSGCAVDVDPCKLHCSSSSSGPIECCVQTSL